MSDATAVAHAPSDAGSREVRPCDSCKQEDDHPRHIHYDAITHPTRRNADGSPYIVDLTEIKHIDCCAADGCPDGSCPIHLEHADGKHGLELAAYLETPSAEHIAAIQAHGIATEPEDNEMPENKILNDEEVEAANAASADVPGGGIVAAPPATAAPGGAS